MNARFRPGLGLSCFSAAMMKPIKTLGAAVVALAAPALFTLPAAADTRGAVAQVETRLGNDTTLTLAIGSTSHDRYGRDYRRGLNEWGQTDWEVRELRRDAEQVCRRAIRQEARYLGYSDVDFDDDLRIRQVGARGFFVTFHEVEFESRKRDVETRISCEIRRGDVVAIDGLPRPVKGKGNGHRW